MQSSVALESTVFAHGLPYPANLETALELEEIVTSKGAAPQTIGLVGGAPIVGLTKAQIRHLATADDVAKVSLRDLPVVAANTNDGATTVAATMHLAHRAGISMMSTGGIGGVHRTLDAEVTWDVSADLEALRRIPITVVCAGPKAILDLPATREVLESYGVTVVGYQTETMPAFYSPSSNLPVDVRCDTPEEVADIIRARTRLDLPGATLVTVPPPDEVALPRDALEPTIEQALADAAERDLRAGAVTPFLLRRLRELEGESIVTANRSLLARNARLAAEVALALG